MSWSLGVDDVFDEDADDLRLQNREWRHNMENRVKDGFVEGMDLGKSEFLQVGFNQGYREGARKTVAIGRLKGIVSAIHCWCQQQQRPPPQDSDAMPRDSAPMPRDSAPAAAVRALLQRVEQHEVRLMTEIRQEMPLVSISDSLGVTIEEEEQGRCSGTGGQEEGGAEGGGGGCGNEGGGGCCGEGGECGKEGGGECGKEERGGGGCGCGNEGGGEGGGECGKEGGGGECGKEGGGCGEGGSKKTDCCQKGGEEKQAHAASSRSSSSSRSFDSSESFNELLQACQQVVEELGLPRELIEHVQSLRSMQ